MAPKRRESMEITQMMPSICNAAAAGPIVAPASEQAASENLALVKLGVELCAQKPAQAGMHETLREAIQLVSRLCDRGISERERTDCALRARGNLRRLEQMLGDPPVPVATAPVRHCPAITLLENSR
jgi:hypothetical protein